MAPRGFFPRPSSTTLSLVLRIPGDRGGKAKVSAYDSVYYPIVGIDVGVKDLLVVAAADGLNRAGASAETVDRRANKVSCFAT